MLDLLRAAARGPLIPAEDDLYGWFVGRWRVAFELFEDGRRTDSGTGRWLAAWVLGGSAVQDVLHRDGAPAHTYGTTLRSYRPATRRWDVVWSCPADGEFVVQTGRRSGRDIVQEGDGRRWTFTEMEPGSFVWLGETIAASGDRRLRQRMTCTRVR